VLGHSFGGMVAAELAATNPERIRKLALLCPIGLWLDEHPVPDISAVPPEMLPSLILADPDGPLAQMMPAPDVNDPDSLFRAALGIASINQFIWPLPDKGLSKRLYRIKAPTLIVWGAQDRLVHPAYGKVFADAISGARLETVDDAGHVPQLEQYDRVLSIVTDFLA